MIRYLTILFSTLTASMLPAQQAYPSKYGEITTNVKNSDTLYGYSYKGKQVLKNKFEKIGSFGGRITIVKLKGKWGFIDETGEVIVKPVYQHAKMMSDYGLVFDHKSNGWKIVTSSGLSYSYDTYSNIQEFPSGYVLLRKSGQQKQSLILPYSSGRGIIEHIDSAVVFRQDQLFLFFSGHKNGKQLSQNKGTDSINLFRFLDLRNGNDVQAYPPYFRYSDSISKSKDSVLIFKSYFSNDVYYFNAFNLKQVKQGKIKNIGGKIYKVEIHDSTTRYGRPPYKGLLIDKEWHLGSVVPLQKYASFSIVNQLITASRPDSHHYNVFDMEGNSFATDVKSVRAMNQYLTLIETSDNNYSLYKGTQMLKKSCRQPKKCNNGYFIIPDSTFRKYSFVNREGNITGDPFDFFYEKKASFDGVTMFGKMITGAVLFEIMLSGNVSVSQNTEYVPRCFDTFTDDSLTGRQIIVTKYLADKKQYLFGTMYENGTLNIPLNYYFLKPVRDWGYIFSVHTKKGYRFGLLSWSGAELIAPGFSAMAYDGSKGDGLLKVTQNERTFYIDKTGKEIKPE